MSRSIAPGVHVNPKEKILSRFFFRALSLVSLTSEYLWYSTFTAYPANDMGGKETLFADVSRLICSRGVA